MVDGSKSVGLEGRLLNYEISSEEEKITTFRTRVEEQIRVIELGMKIGSVNDINKCQNYIDKARRFLSIPFFTGKKNKDKRLRNLKRILKIEVGISETQKQIMEDINSQRRGYKESVASKFFNGSNLPCFSYVDTCVEALEKEISSLNEKVPVYSSELILVNTIIGALKDKDISSAIGCKNSWKVRTLKEKLAEWVEAEASSEEKTRWNEIFKLDYFRHKKYLDMEVRELAATLDVRAATLTGILDWISSLMKSLNEDKEYFKKNSKDFETFTIGNWLRHSDFEIQKSKNLFNEFGKYYSLCRFGQGLIEADIFDTLYK